MKNIVILISGRGSNFVAIAEQAKKEHWDKEGIRIALVVSNRPDAAGLAKAQDLGIPTAVIDHKAYPDRESFERAMIQVIDPLNPVVIVLAGFMRVLTEVFIHHYEGKILNIHPALLPLFKGLDTHKRALEAGVRVHGCTVHFASCELDGGPIVGQAVVPVVPTDTPEKLAARGLKLEHVLFPRCVHAVATGAVKLQDGRVMMSARTAQNLAVFDNLIE